MRQVSQLWFALLVIATFISTAGSCGGDDKGTASSIFTCEATCADAHGEPVDGSADIFEGTHSDVATKACTENQQNQPAKVLCFGHGTFVNCKCFAPGEQELEEARAHGNLGR